MFQRHAAEDWKFEDGTSLATYEHEGNSLLIYYDAQGMFAFSIDRRDSRSSNVRSTSWHRDHGLSDTVAKPGPDPDLGQLQSCEPADRRQLAKLIRIEGVQLPERFKSTILQVLEGNEKGEKGVSP